MNKKFTAIQIENIKTFAVAYSAYNMDIINNNDNGIKVWGRILIRTQTKLGIHLRDNKRIQALIDTIIRSEGETI